MATLWVRHAPSSAAVARRSVAAAFQAAGLSADEAYDAALIASELVSNAVRHGSALPSGHLVVEWTFGPEGYTISVTNASTPGARIAARVADSVEATGRGLLIVAALARDWGVAEADGCTTVWARGELPARFRLPSLHSVG